MWSSVVSEFSAEVALFSNEDTGGYLLFTYPLRIALQLDMLKRMIKHVPTYMVIFFISRKFMRRGLYAPKYWTFNLLKRGEIPYIIVRWASEKGLKHPSTGILPGLIELSYLKYRIKYVMVRKTIMASAAIIATITKGISGIRRIFFLDLRWSFKG
jgi:hypothetical protein